MIKIARTKLSEEITIQKAVCHLCTFAQIDLIYIKAQ